MLARVTDKKWIAKPPLSVNDFFDFPRRADFIIILFGFHDVTNKLSICQHPRPLKNGSK